MVIVAASSTAAAEQMIVRNKRKKKVREKICSDFTSDDFMTRIPSIYKLGSRFKGAVYATTLKNFESIGVQNLRHEQ
jgi:hypothetical protein